MKEPLFSSKADFIFNVVVIGVIITILFIALYFYLFFRSSFRTYEQVALEQPVPFSHRHHVEGLGIDCRYCHESAEKSSSAGIPSSNKCMNCHWQLWTQAELLEPVRESWEQDIPIQWNRVHDLPDYVYFNHSIHVQKGISCQTCHGNVNQMAIVYKEEALFMQWCLDCHRNPEDFVRPKDEIYNFEWKRPKENDYGMELIKINNIDTKGLTNCSMCHR